MAEGCGAAECSPDRSAESYDSLAELCCGLVEDASHVFDAVRGPRRMSVGAIARKFISEHFAEPITMAEVANSVDLTYSYFSRVFHDEVGMSFSDYLMEVRMTEAARALLSPTARISDVAAAAGYDNPKHFTRAFRNYHGVAPIRYRQLRCSDDPMARP